MDHLPLPRLMPRAQDAHKASVGRVLVLGGSRGMAGAPALAGRAALRMGAGLVKVAVPASIQPTVAGFQPEFLTHGLPEHAGGGLDATGIASELDALVENVDAVVVGPGAGRNEATLLALQAVMKRCPRSLLVDADALFALVADPAATTGRPADTILTPHEGEAARLAGCTAAELRQDREQRARDLVTKYGGVCVLKGPDTIIADAKHAVRETLGGPELAMGGTGDVLAGAIAALLARGLAPFDAARLGVHLHARAGRFAARGRPAGLLASEVADALPAAAYEYMMGSA